MFNYLYSNNILYNDMYNGFEYELNKKDIELVAYHIWKSENCPFNREMQNWIDAENMLIRVHGDINKILIKI